MMLNQAPLIVAHRGIHKQHPENSLEAFLLAWNGGFAWCECDVHAARDGVPIVIHDPTLERTTSGTGAVAARTAAELTELHLKDASGAVTNCRVPTLKAVIDAMPQNCGMFVEIKGKQGSRAEELATSIVKILQDRLAVIQSFDATYLYHTRRLDRVREHYLLVDKDQNWDAGVWDGINFQHEMLTPYLVEKLRGLKKKWGAWTVNAQPHIGRILELAPDVLITDEPELVSRARSESGK